MSSHHTLTLLFGILSTGLAVAFELPQWLRLRKTRSSAGVSLPSITNTTISTFAWLVYGLHLHDLWVTTTAAAGLPVLLVTLIAVVRTGIKPDGMWIPALWTGILLATVAMHPWAPGLLPAVLGASILWYVTPAVITAWRSSDVTGLASGTWLLLILDATIVGTYGLLAHVAGYLYYSIIASTGALLVLARLHLARQHPCGVCPPLKACRCAAPA